MPIDILRFGVGHRRADGPAGTRGVEARVIHSDERGVVAELAFGRGALVEPHANPNTTYFMVIEGGGWVLVGDERARVAAGDAVVWPPSVVHGAWTEDTTMRAFIVEFPGGDAGDVAGVLDGTARPALPSERPVARAEGGLSERVVRATQPDPTSGEPL